MKRAMYRMPLEFRAAALKSAVAALLAGILSVQTALAASGSAFPKAAPVEQSAKAAAMKQKVLKVQLQSMVVVKLKNKEQLRGRLTQVTDENFTVKVLQGENFADRQLAYSEVKSFRPEKSGGSTVKKVILYSAIAGAILTAVAILGLIYGDH